MDLEQIELLNKAYENIVTQQYMNAVENFEAGSLKDKQV